MMRSALFAVLILAGCQTTAEMDHAECSRWAAPGTETYGRCRADLYRIRAAEAERSTQDLRRSQDCMSNVAAGLACSGAPVRQMPQYQQPIHCTTEYRFGRAETICN